jgi:quercetin dioxygenase-like cupin family protein
MHVVSLKNVTKVVPQMEGAANLYKQIPIGTAEGTPHFSFRVFTILPGGHTPLHRHAFEHLNYIIQGHGEVVRENDTALVGAGDFVLVMPNELHQYRNISDQELILICAVPKEYE